MDDLLVYLEQNSNTNEDEYEHCDVHTDAML